MAKERQLRLFDFLLRIFKPFSGRLIYLKILYAFLFLLLTKTDGELLLMKGRYKGRRCFVIGLGPSLRIDDLELLKDNGELCFSVNGIHRLFDKTEWRPDFYFISDRGAYAGENRNAINKAVETGDISCFFYPKLDMKPDCSAIGYKPDNRHLLRENAKSERIRRKKGFCGFEKDIREGVKSGSTSINSVLQLAAFMGFTEIYLLGADCGVSKNKWYGAAIDPDNTLGGGHGDEPASDMIEDYAQQKPAMDALGIKVYNATRGGFLEVFPRMDFDALMTNVRRHHR